MVTKLQSPGNKLMPLHGSKIKAHERKRLIINTCGAIETLKDKRGINATKERPLASVSNKATSNQGINIVRVLSSEGDCQGSNIRSRNVARVVMS